VATRPANPDPGLYTEHYADFVFKWLFWLFPEEVLFVLGLRWWGKPTGPMSTDYFVDEYGRQAHPDCATYLEGGGLGFLELDNQGNILSLPRYSSYISTGVVKYAMDHRLSLPVAHAAVVYTSNAKAPRRFNRIEIPGVYAYTPEIIFLEDLFLLDLKRLVEKAEEKAKDGIDPFAKPVYIVMAVLAVLACAGDGRADLCFRYCAVAKKYQKTWPSSLAFTLLMRVSSHYIEEAAFGGLMKEIYDVDEFFNQLNQSTNGQLLNRILQQNNADNTAAMAELQAKYDAQAEEKAKERAEFKAALTELKAALAAKEKAEIKAAVAQQRAESEIARIKAEAKAQAKLEAAQREIALLKSGKGPAGGPTDG
jgi:hypothetical protein